MSSLAGPIHEWTARQIAVAVARRELDCETVTRACLERIEAREAAVGAWAFIDPSLAIEQARALDRAGPSGPLSGVPFGVKDIIDTFDMPTAYGSPIYAGFRPRRDASCVALGRRAGGIAMGKTVTAEFAVSFPGKTRHPQDAERTPGGSSSGSAAAVADGMVPLALGTQTTGSTIKPGSYCGVFALRPTVGDVRCSGVMESSGSCDAVGLYARNADDLALHLDVLVGRTPQPLPEAGRGPRIGFVRPPQWSKLEASTQRLLEAGADRLARAGARVDELPLPDEFARAEEAHRAITCREFVLNFAREIDHHWDALSEELRAGKIRVGLATSFDQYREAQVIAVRCREGIEAMFAKYDVLLAPAAAGEAPIGWNTGDSSFASPWTLMHTPCVSVPVFTGPNGLPVGAQLIGARGSDRSVLAAARWVHERLTG